VLKDLAQRPLIHIAVAEIDQVHLSTAASRGSVRHWSMFTICSQQLRGRFDGSRNGIFVSTRRERWRPVFWYRIGSAQKRPLGKCRSVA
jgi:hypothetical protein